MSIECCIPVIPSSDIEKSLHFWIDGLGFEINNSSTVKPEGYEGVRFYWAARDIRETSQRLKDLGYAVSDVVERYYGQTEFVTSDGDGASRIGAARLSGDLAGFLADLEAKGVEVKGHQQMDGVGKFAWILDPDGTKIEFWEPAR